MSSELGNKLEMQRVILPIGWRNEILRLDSSPNVCEFADAVVHNVAMFEGDPQCNLNAAHVVAAIFATITKMMEARFVGNKIVAAHYIVPEYLAILITDPQIRHESILYFNEKTSSLVGAYIKKFGTV